MRNVLAAVSTAVVMMIAVSPARADDVLGTWTGSIEIPGQPLNVSVNFTATDKATFDIPAQGAKAVSFDAVSVTGKEVKLTIAKVGAVMKGTVDGKTISGTLEQGGQTFPFKLTRGSGYQPPPPPRKPLTATAGARLLGTWKGEVGGRAFTFEFREDKGLVVATSTSEHACGGPPYQNVTLTFDKIHLEQPGLGIDGVLVGDHEMSGVVHEASGDVPWKLTRDTKGAVATKPYKEIEVSIPSANGVVLAGTLTLPEGAPAPVVVTITGSGPEDRDECVFGIRPFAQLADRLARNGVATLRYDDRGTAKSTGTFATSTTADFADDAEAAVKFLASRGDVDAKHIGVLGHSEGGYIGPMVAARNPAVTFVAMWAGPALPIDKVIIRQTGEGLKAEGTPPDKVAKAVANQTLIWGLWRANKDPVKFKAAVAAAAKTHFDKKELADIGDVDKWVEAETGEMLSPWMVWYRDYDPRATLGKLTVPVLAINGALDKQVDPKQNLPVIKQSLTKTKDVTIVELPGLNHMFQVAKTGGVSEYAKLPPVVDDKVLDLTTEWIRKRTGLK